jgi:hypothetical protein
MCCSSASWWRHPDSTQLQHCSWHRSCCKHIAIQSLLSCVLVFCAAPSQPALLSLFLSAPTPSEFTAEHKGQIITSAVAPSIFSEESVTLAVTGGSGECVPAAAVSLTSGASAYYRRRADQQATPGSARPWKLCGLTHAVMGRPVTSLSVFVCLLQVPLRVPGVPSPGRMVSPTASTPSTSTSPRCVWWTACLLRVGA